MNALQWNIYKKILNKSEPLLDSDIQHNSGAKKKHTLRGENTEDCNQNFRSLGSYEFYLKLKRQFLFNAEICQKMSFRM